MWESGPGFNAHWKHKEHLDCFPACIVESLNYSHRGRLFQGKSARAPFLTGLETKKRLPCIEMLILYIYSYVCWATGCRNKTNRTSCEKPCHLRTHHGPISCLIIGTFKADVQDATAMENVWITQIILSSYCATVIKDRLASRKDMRLGHIWYWNVSSSPAWPDWVNEGNLSHLFGTLPFVQQLSEHMAGYHEMALQ